MVEDTKWGTRPRWICSKPMAENGVGFPLPHREWRLGKGFWREYLQGESLGGFESQFYFSRGKGGKCFSLTRKQVEGHWVHSVTLMSAEGWTSICFIGEETESLPSTLVVGVKAGCSWPGHILWEFVGVKGTRASLGPEMATPEKGLPF